MLIKSIKTVGFRKFKDEFKTKLYKITEISGKNTSGKTNILFAIVWAFLGTNLTGDERFWPGNKEMENCYVELKFVDNQGIEHSLVRNKNKYNNSKNFIMLDNRQAKQEDLVSFYSDKKLFLSILNPNYFISKKPAEQKELIDRYLPDLDIKKVYEKLDDMEKLIVLDAPNNINLYISELRANKKLNEDRIKNLRGKIEYAEAIVNTKIEEKKQFLKDEELSLDRQELSFLLADKVLVDKVKQKELVDSIEREIAQSNDRILKLSNKMKIGKQEYLTIKNEAKGKCPTCKQVIENEARDETIKNMKAELEQFFEERNKLENDLTDIKIKLNMEKCKLYAIDENTDNKIRVAEIEEQINSLETEKKEIDSFNNIIDINIKNVLKAKEDIEIFNKQIQDYNKSIEHIEKTIKVAQKLYINYIEEKMKFATKHLKDVSIKYYSVLKDSGELKDDFIITYKGNEFKNLSKSETIATSIELSNMFNKISGVNLPLFIDDSESCADYNFTQDYSLDSQVIIAKVSKGQELEIKEYSLESESYLQAA